MPTANEGVLVLDREIVKRYALAYLDTEDGKKTLETYPDNRAFIANGYDEDPYEWDSVAIEYMNAVVGEGLNKAHEYLIRKHFDADAMRYPDRWGPGYLNAKTPEGPREFGSFGVSYYGDENAPRVIGVSLWGRDFPTWLDWRWAHGGSGEPFIFNREMETSIILARDAMAETLPEIREAPFAIVLNHY